MSFCSVGEVESLGHGLSPRAGLLGTVCGVCSGTRVWGRALPSGWVPLWGRLPFFLPNPSFQGLSPPGCPQVQGGSGCREEAPASGPRAGQSWENRRGSHTGGSLPGRPSASYGSLSPTHRVAPRALLPGSLLSGQSLGCGRPAPLRRGYKCPS